MTYYLECFLFEIICMIQTILPFLSLFVYVVLKVQSGSGKYGTLKQATI